MYFLTSQGKFGFISNRLVQHYHRTMWVSILSDSRMNNMHHMTKTGVPTYLNSCSFSDNAPAKIEITVQRDDPSRKIYFIKGKATRKGKCLQRTRFDSFFNGNTRGTHFWSAHPLNFSTLV